MLQTLGLALSRVAALLVLPTVVVCLPATQGRRADARPIGNIS
jgi:hypothetical protein